MINSFKKSLKYMQENNISHKSVIWNDVIENKFGNIKKEDLENFRNNSLGKGHDNSFKDDLDEIHKILKNSLENYYLNKHLELLPNLNENYGNLKKFVAYKNKIFHKYTISELEYFDLITENFLNNKQFQNILEIGSGYGWFSRLLLKKYSNIKYFIIDLPETNLLSNYYLKNSFKNFRILNYELMNDEVLNKKNIENYDIFILPPFIKIGDVIFDVIINRHSMMEMKKNEIAKYFKIIGKNSKLDTIFINQNRYYTDASGFRNYLYKYPYEKNWEVIYSKPTKKRRIHLIVTRKVDKETNSIPNELKKIKNLTKNHSPIRFIPLFLIKIYRKIKKNVFK